MKARKFENVEVGHIVTFEERGGMIVEGVVVEVKDKTFVLRILDVCDRDGVKTFYERHLNFLKTGTKSSHRYNYGNAIEITGRI
jgi:hypothetical protein